MRAALRLIWMASTLLLTPSDGCLSNPSLQCSPSHFSASSSFDVRCSATAGTSMYQTGKYNGFLGESVQARAYSGKGKETEWAKEDLDLRCHDQESCRWWNDPNDELDWVNGIGEVDPAKMALITGSNTMPEDWFLLLASDPRSSEQGGSLISPPIGCQQSSGILSFRLWRSRSRDFQNEPKIDICTRRMPEATLENCLTIQMTENHTIVASIPPLLEPFEIVLRGHDFSNTPEGGLIIMDRIDYFAHLDTPENCFGKDQLLEFEPLRNETNEDFFEDAELLHPTLTNISTVDVVVRSNLEEDDSDRAFCNQLECTMRMNPPCAYSTVGMGSDGIGFFEGWQVINVPLNIANRLTGIHVSPGLLASDMFLLAEFPGFNRTRISHVFVLESLEFRLPAGKSIYLGFRKYLATQGVELAVCETPDFKNCIWDNFLHSAFPFSRSWISELVLLPSEVTKLHFIARQDKELQANNGQIGLADFALFLDAEGEQSAC